MGKGKNDRKMTRDQRKNRVYQVIFFTISIIVLLTMILSLTIR